MNQKHNFKDVKDYNKANNIDDAWGGAFILFFMLFVGIGLPLLTAVFR